MRSAMIDTEIWILAKKKPVRNKFSSEEDFQRFMEVHRKALRFFQSVVPELRIYMSLHQVAEIFHVLAFRGSRIPVSEAEDIVRAIMLDGDVIKVPVSEDHLVKAISESSETGIHLWDFLCFLPVSEYVDVVYSADEHFLKICERHGIRLSNPLGIWLKC